MQLKLGNSVEGRICIKGIQPGQAFCQLALHSKSSEDGRQERVTSPFVFQMLEPTFFCCELLAIHFSNCIFSDLTDEAFVTQEQSRSRPVELKESGPTGLHKSQTRLQLNLQTFLQATMASGVIGVI